MNIREFARYCQVSPATVSRYFSGEARLSDEVRDRIRNAVAETGYAPSAQYQRRKKGSSGVVAVITPYFQHRFFMDILSALKEQGMELGYRLVVFSTGGEGDLTCLPALYRLSVEGVILLHEGGGDPLPEQLHKDSVQAVMCGGLCLSRLFPSVHIDDISAAYDGANYLIGLGHRDIAVISDQPHAISSGFQRITGCRKALEDAGLALREDYLAYAGHSFADGYQAMKRLLDQGCTATAVFAFNDTMAAGAVAALHDAGRQVPMDVSVLGFDDSSTAREIRPLLTTVSQPLAQMARRSLEVLLTGSGSAESITLPHSIALRESCRQL